MGFNFGMASMAMRSMRFSTSRRSNAWKNYKNRWRNNSVQSTKTHANKKSLLYHQVERQKINNMIGRIIKDKSHGYAIIVDILMMKSSPEYLLVNLVTSDIFKRGMDEVELINWDEFLKFSKPVEEMKSLISNSNEQNELTKNQIKAQRKTNSLAWLKKFNEIQKINDNLSKFDLYDYLSPTAMKKLSGYIKESYAILRSHQESAGVKVSEIPYYYNHEPYHYNHEYEGEQ